MKNIVKVNNIEITTDLKPYTNKTKFQYNLYIYDQMEGKHVQILSAADWGKCDDKAVECIKLGIDYLDIYVDMQSFGRTPEEKYKNTSHFGHLQAHLMAQEYNKFR